MEVIVVGTGNAARALLRRLARKRWDVVVVDDDATGLEEVEPIRPMRPVLGSPTDPDVLRVAGLEEGSLLVAAADDDGVNLAVARHVQVAGGRCVALAADPERLPAYRDLGVPAFSPDRLVARRFVSLLEPRRVFSAGFADGRAEGFDFRIVSRSPVCGMALRDVPGEGWVVVAILRRGELIIPHGDTVFEEEDVVTVVGSAADFVSMVDTFTARVARFPTDFGSSVVVPLRTPGDIDGLVREAVHVARGSRASGIIFVHRDPASARGAQGERIEQMVDAALRLAEGCEVKTVSVDGDPEKAALSGELALDPGLIVVAPPRVGLFRWRFRVARLLRSVARRQRPVLISRGSYPYHRVVVPARDTPAGRAAAAAAMDVAAYEDAAMVAISVIPPLFMAGDDAREEALRTAAMVQQEAAVQGVDVRRVVEQGNEVRLIASWADRSSLVVLGQRRRNPSVITPGVAGLVVSRLDSSVIVVPYRR